VGKPPLRARQRLSSNSPTARALASCGIRVRMSGGTGSASARSSGLTSAHKISANRLCGRRPRRAKPASPRPGHACPALACRLGAARGSYREGATGTRPRACAGRVARYSWRGFAGRR
jgi:hypothetical protein